VRAGVSDGWSLASGELRWKELVHPTVVATLTNWSAAMSASRRGLVGGDVRMVGGDVSGRVVSPTVGSDVSGELVGSE
jgi:hypothetical protein